MSFDDPQLRFKIRMKKQINLNTVFHKFIRTNIVFQYLITNIVCYFIYNQTSTNMIIDGVILQFFFENILF